jgi:hypothetical protein
VFPVGFVASRYRKLRIVANLGRFVVHSLLKHSQYFVLVLITCVGLILFWRHYRNCLSIVATAATTTRYGIPALSPIHALGLLDLTDSLLAPSPLAASPEPSSILAADILISFTSPPVHPPVDPITFMSPSAPLFLSPPAHSSFTSPVASRPLAPPSFTSPPVHPHDRGHGQLSVRGIRQ